MTLINMQIVIANYSHSKNLSMLIVLVIQYNWADTGYAPFLTSKQPVTCNRQSHRSQTDIDNHLKLSVSILIHSSPELQILNVIVHAYFTPLPNYCPYFVPTSPSLSLQTSNLSHQRPLYTLRYNSHTSFLQPMLPFISFPAPLLWNSRTTLRILMANLQRSSSSLRRERL